MNPLPKVELRLNEENELSFKLSIEGTTSDPKSKPKFRFLITDFGSDKGIVYPCVKEPNDVIKVLIPGLRENYNANKKYLGKLEVILGSLYFTPTELLISFKEPLKIKAAPVTVVSSAKDKNLIAKPSQTMEDVPEEIEDEDLDSEEEEEEEYEEEEEDDEEIDEDSEEESDPEDLAGEEEEEELTEKAKPKYREEYHQLASEAVEDKINLDEFFISDPASPKETLPPSTINGFNQIAFAPKAGTILAAPGFSNEIPNRVARTFTPSGLPLTESEKTSTLQETSKPEDSFQNSPLSKAATAAKNNLKKAFLEALSYAEPQPIAQPIKESADKNKTTLEEAKKLLMSAEENRKKKIAVSAQVSNVAFNKPKSLKDLFSKDFLD